MVIMNKSRLGAPAALCAVALVPTTLGCGLSSRGTSAAPEQASSVVGGSAIPAAPATDDSNPPPRPGSRTALVDDLASTQTDEDVDSVTAEGTDSVTTTAAPAPVDATTRDRLERFGRHYLAFDHRSDPGARAIALEPLVTAPLLAELAAPLPAALLDDLAREERVVVPSLVSLEPLGDGAASNVFRLTYDVTTSARFDGGDRTTETEIAVITVVVDADGLVADVR